jgi:DNA-binding MarR family transcriptional regulator
MTDTPTLSGQDIGQAERATRAVLDALLAETDTPFVDWVVLNVLATGPGALARDVLAGRLTQGLKLDDASVEAAIDQVIGRGLVTDGDLLRLTADGQALFQRISDGIRRIAERLYGDLPPEDLATAHRVLATVTQRANAELAH